MRRLSVLVLLCGGCLTGRRHIELPPAAPQASACVEVRPFADARQDRTQVGNVRNGFGSVIGEVHTDDDVAAWVGTHVASHLTNVDCRRGSYIVEGSVHEAYVDDVFRTHARVAATLTVRRDGELVLRETFRGKAAALHWGTAEDYRRLLHDAVVAMSRTAARRVAIAI